MEEVSQVERTSADEDDHAVPAESGLPSFFCCGRNKKQTDQFALDNSPDAEFHADSLIKLTHGVTAYRIIEPKDMNTKSLDTVPIIVLLHSLHGASYMWADIADLLSDFEQGPQAKILVFDFYGRGRSPWTGVDITLDTLVTQTKELMDGNETHVLYATMSGIFSDQQLCAHDTFSLESDPPGQAGRVRRL